MINGILDLPWWGVVAFALALTHLTIVSVTIYLHRCMAHRAIELHPALAHFFRFWIWLTTGMRTHQWMAVHRKHHAKVDSDNDPHSPVRFGLRKVLLQGAELYAAEASNAQTVAQYGAGRPDDWIERHLYTPHGWWGPGLMLIIDVLFFGPIGLTVWAVQMLWIPVLAAGVVNGLGHHSGYRRFETPDTSTNLVPWGILIGGEELHNNHHAFASSARFSMHPSELDIGWQYIRALRALKLLEVRKLPPQLSVCPEKRVADHDTLQAVFAGRFEVLSRYGRTVVKPTLSSELRRVDKAARRALARARKLLLREESLLCSDSRARVHEALEHSPALTTVYQYQRRLKALWSQRAVSQERLLGQLQDWCRQAEASGVKALEEFAQTLRSYSLQANGVGAAQ